MAACSSNDVIYGQMVFFAEEFVNLQNQLDIKQLIQGQLCILRMIISSSTKRAMSFARFIYSTYSMSSGLIICV